MSQASHNNQIDYIEFPAVDISKIKEFYSSVFGWKFEDYGPDYTSFADGRLAGGFTKDAPLPVKGILVVLYASDLEGTASKVKAAGASVTKEIFSFAGGRRFHFKDPSGNELAVWSE
jgi:predicted enzyme related to lactoylglutathione lyase